MNLRPEPRRTHSIQGQLLRLSERREVAIFLRDGALWIADFVDGQGALIDAITWFRFNCGSPSTWHARRRVVLESAIPLSEELVERIERLHRPAAADNCRTAVRLVKAIAARLAQCRLAAMVAHRVGRRRLHPLDSATRKTTVTVVLRKEFIMTTNRTSHCFGRRDVAPAGIDDNFVCIAHSML